MRNYTCQTCGEGVLLEPREVEESGAFCLEHLFSEEFPALNELANEASEQETTWPARQDDNQVAQTTTQERAEDMSQSTATLEPTNKAITDIIEYLLGDHTTATVVAYTSIREDVVRNRLAGRGLWTVPEVAMIAEMLGVTPARFMSSIWQVANYGQDVDVVTLDLAHASRA